uniref:RING-type domain-containing protein n=1 Tax=Parastrongyloides trichosuri TaxID=131310 RepID=A0A0N4ZW93_PARTI
MESGKSLPMKDYTDVCQKCFQAYTPRDTTHEKIVLQCGDTFGKSCIDVIDSFLGFVFQCPFCKQISLDIPYLGIDDMVRSFEVLDKDSEILGDIVTASKLEE